MTIAESNEGVKVKKSKSSCSARAAESATDIKVKRSRAAVRCYPPLPCNGGRRDGLALEN
jgi:hypothetical protein